MTNASVKNIKYAYMLLYQSGRARVHASVAKNGHYPPKVCF